jgi:hypothetical protein
MLGCWRRATTLAQEARDERRIADERGMHHLDCHLAPGRGIGGPVDQGHPTLAEQGIEAISPEVLI